MISILVLAACINGLLFSSLVNVQAFADVVVSCVDRRRARPIFVSHQDCIDADNGNHVYTTAVIKCAYDGTYFRGWTAGNSEPSDIKHNKRNDNKVPATRRQSRRSRTLRRKGGGYGKGGRIRTVEDAIQSCLAKIYGDVDRNRVKIEACSRTDAGVHATSLVAQFYCIKVDYHSAQSTSAMRPRSYNDANFMPLPFDSDLSKLVFVLNRMLPDIRVVAASPLPDVSFHPTLNTTSKTYRYKFAVGPVHDPLQTEYIWHLDGSSSRAVGMNYKRFSLERAKLAANLFVDSSDQSMNIDTAPPRNYGAFRAAFRGTDRGRVQSTICKLWRCDILTEQREQLPSWENGSDASTTTDIKSQSRFGSRLQRATTDGSSVDPRTFTVLITGDRFLYKMVRNIVGAIVAVGCGHLEIEDVRVALETGKWGDNPIGTENESDEEEQTGSTKTIRRICAPARGLTLVAVDYQREIHFDWRTG